MRALTRVSLKVSLNYRDSLLTYFFRFLQIKQKQHLILELINVSIQHFFPRPYCTLALLEDLGPSRWGRQVDLDPYGTSEREQMIGNCA